MKNEVITPPTFFSPIHVPQNWQLPSLHNVGIAAGEVEAAISRFFDSNQSVHFKQEEIDNTADDINKSVANITWVDHE